jgi:sarcosine oxidase subunit beta
MVGFELDVTPLRRQVLVTEGVPGLPRTLPMTIDFANGFYFHREGAGLLMGVNFEEQPGFKLEYDEGWLPELFDAIEHRAPALSSVGVQSGWAGLYEVSPDHNALIGEAPGVSRFLYATGFSGHGFLQAPAVGEIIRDLVLEREPFVDVSALSADRFSRGDERPERNII